MEVKIETLIAAPLERTWAAWITPEHIQQWNFATDDWCCPRANMDFKVGGRFSHRMEAKDGSMGFDFGGQFTSIQEYKSIEYILDDNRKVKVSFNEAGGGVQVVETFEAESENPVEMQKQGWQSILNNFKNYLEKEER